MANRSTKKSLERFKYEVADELGQEFHLATDTTETLPQNRTVLSADIWSKK